jgi:membrane-bound metal-dependent hydrolase YbcI (DUF457 family)
MHLLAHAATAVPFLLTGNYLAAVGCVIPDLTWVHMEYKFRVSGERSWYVWAKALSPRTLIPYRIAHSLLLIALAALTNLWLTGECWLFVGWTIHVLLDLPTHWGIMQPLPLYPFKWKWPYVLKHIKQRSSAE